MAATKKHQCLRCPKRFVKKYALDAHNDWHDGIKRFRCEPCQKAFTRQNDLRAHNSEQHTSAAKTSCSICGAAFHRKSSLSRHWKRHRLVQLVADACSEPVNLAAVVCPTKAAAAGNAAMQLDHTRVKSQPHLQYQGDGLTAAMCAMYLSELEAYKHVSAQAYADIRSVTNHLCLSDNSAQLLVAWELIDEIRQTLGIPHSSSFLHKFVADFTTSRLAITGIGNSSIRRPSLHDIDALMSATYKSYKNEIKAMTNTLEAPKLIADSHDNSLSDKRTILAELNSLPLSMRARTFNLLGMAMSRILFATKDNYPPTSDAVEYDSEFLIEKSWTELEYEENVLNARQQRAVKIIHFFERMDKTSRDEMMDWWKAIALPNFANA